MKNLNSSNLTAFIHASLRMTKWTQGALIASLVVLLSSPALAGDEWTMTKVGSWSNVKSMSVSQDEKYIVFSQAQPDGSEIAFETTLNGFSWSTAKPIDPVNAIGNVGGLFLSDDCRHLYFHAKADDANGYDLYVSVRSGNSWGKPSRINDLCTAGDDMFPSVTEGGQEIYFLRHQTISDSKAERKEADKMSIYHAKLNKKGKWARILPINPAVSFGYVQDARIMRDGVSLLYSTKPEKRDNARPAFTRRVQGDHWLLPEFMNSDDSRDFFCLQNAGDHLYLITMESRKTGTAIFRTNIPNAKFANNIMATECGKVINEKNHSPINASLEIRNPTTSDLQGLFDTDATNGAYHVVSKAASDHILEVRADGYSFFSQMLQYDAQGTPQMPSTIELFDTATVGITLFDKDIFQPIDGKVIAVRQTDKAIFRSTKGRNGWYALHLPLGCDYNIIATAKGFAENSFLFKISGDITFNHYERELPMSPKRRDITVHIYDDVTNEVIAAQAAFNSLDRDENLTLAPGKNNMSLREGDRYNITVHPKGYMFANLTINLASDNRSQIDIPLTALRAGASLLLHDIFFDVNQAFLRPESYAELDRLVRLMNENPDLKIEIQAHTDNQGRAAYNKKLSDRRADSALQYLIENGIAPERMSSVGFGDTKPVADNTTEEGRQQNRRVELIIID